MLEQTNLRELDLKESNWHTTNRKDGITSIEGMWGSIVINNAHSLLVSLDTGFNLTSVNTFYRRVRWTHTKLNDANIAWKDDLIGVFPLSDLDQVAKAIKARKKIKYSAEVLEKKREIAIRNLNL